MKTITLRRETCESIVIDEMIEHFHDENEREEPDYSLLRSFQTVLGYYMPPSEYREWVKNNPISKDAITRNKV